MKEKLFCRYYCVSCDAESSAKKAGYSKNPLDKAYSLMLREDICEEISHNAKVYSRVLFSISTVLYHKLACSTVSDAVGLLFSENPEKEKLKDMDLFMVSEIKKPKDGAMEIKFFDRLKALEKLIPKHSDDHNNSNGLVDALYMGAKCLSDEKSDGFGV